jgi:hypothetical protein
MTHQHSIVETSDLHGPTSITASNSKMKSSQPGAMGEGGGEGQSGHPLS